MGMLFSGSYLEDGVTPWPAPTPTQPPEKIANYINACCGASVGAANVAVEINRLRADDDRDTVSGSVAMLDIMSGGTYLSKKEFDSIAKAVAESGGSSDCEPVSINVDLLSEEQLVEKIKALVADESGDA
jgi:hypothetical protein